MLSLVLTYFVYANDVRMTQAGHCFGLGTEPLYEFRARELAEEQHFHRYSSVQGTWRAR